MTSDATDGGLALSYDQENRISGTGGYTYTYDADGNRVKKTNGTTGTIYWYMTLGIVAESDLSGALKSEYVFFDGERVARRDLPAGSVAYYFSDHLKTASVITDSLGNIKSESDYYPWGGELQFVANDSNHYKFTGKERDETGLDYFGARYYSNGLARFITPDWSSTPIPVPYADFADPQSLNQYSYVRNVPTSRVDADGHDGVTAAAVWELFTGGADWAGISGGFWTAGSVALPGLLGGGLAHLAINSIAENYNIVANAQMQEVVTSNKLIVAQQAALAKDAQAGGLIKEGKDANDKAAATIDAANKGIAAGKYEDRDDVQTHIDKLKGGMADVQSKINGVKTAVGQKARDAAKAALKKATKEVKGHEKDLQQKPKVKEEKQ
jgi:RHS repeat-associated protein